jgi:hypothetical protein
MQDLNHFHKKVVASKALRSEIFKYVGLDQMLGMPTPTL